MTQTQMLMDQVMFKFYSLHFVLPSSLPDSILEVLATGDQSKLVDFSGLNSVGNIWDNVRIHNSKECTGKT